MNKMEEVEKLIYKIENHLIDLEKTFKSTTNKFKDTIGDLERMNVSSRSGGSGSSEDLSTQFEAFKTDLTNQFETFQAGVTTRISNLDTNLTTFQNTTNQSLTTLSGNVETISSNVSGLETNLNAITPQIATLESNINTLGQNVSTLQGSVSTLQGSVSTLESSVTELGGNLSTLQSSVTNITQNVIPDLEDKIENASGGGGATGGSEEQWETVYDSGSTNADLNWGYTDGIMGGTTISTNLPNFFKYKKLRLYHSFMADYVEKVFDITEVPNQMAKLSYGGHCLRFLEADVSTGKAMFVACMSIEWNNHAVTGLYFNKVYRIAFPDGKYPTITEMKTKAFALRKIEGLPL